jgi:hypothetical protein
MKRSFSFSLEGKDWWKPYLLFWILNLLVQGITRKTTGAAGGQAGEAAVSLVFGFLGAILQAAFTIVFARIMLPRLSVNGKAFSFDGKIGEYLGLNIGGFLLSVITLGIYAPWYMRKIVAYLASRTEYDGGRPEFLGKGGKLFKYFLLAFLLPLIVLLVPLFILAARDGWRGVGTGASAQLISTLTTFVLVFLILGPFMYLLYFWYLNLRWKDVSITWKTEFWPSVGFIMGQLALSVVTLSIYWPVAFVKCLAYFAGKTAFYRGAGPAATEIGRLGIDRGEGGYFGFIWGQTLLTIITLGVYAPWAIAKLGRWACDRLYYEENGEVA